MLLISLYVPYIVGGFVRWAAFPLITFFTDLPNCPRCDDLVVHSPLLEWLLLSIPLYWICLAIARWQRRERLKAYLGHHA